MTSVAIIGAGDLGGAVAQALAARDRVARVMLIDPAAAVAAGKALDIQQSGAVHGFHARLTATDDLSRAAGAAVCVLADRVGSPPSEWRDEEGLALVTRVLTYIGDAPLVFAGTQQTGLMLGVARERGVPRHRLIGSAPQALASAIRSMVGLETRCSPDEVSLSVLGTPPAGFVVPWSEASVAGYRLEGLLTQVQLARLEARSARLWPPGPFTLGLAAARVVEAIIRSSRRSFAALTLLGGEFGVRNRVGALPVFLGARGIVDVRVPALNTRERVQLETALAIHDS
jgi:malate dehydrogenase